MQYTTGGGAYALAGGFQPGIMPGDQEIILTISEWGLVILGLLLAIGGNLYFGRRRGRDT